MSRMNWKTNSDRQRIRRQGSETIRSGAEYSAPPCARATGTRRKAPPLAEPVIIDKWWRNRAGDAVYVRLSSFEGHNLIDVRSWRADREGISQPGKGIALSVKHLPRLYAAIGKAMAEARARGLIDDGGEASK
jgi:Transcriptional Coactivator p15 (PC4)